MADRGSSPLAADAASTDHIEGCLLGLAVGDALGTTLEFTRPEDLPPWPTLLDGPHTEVVGGGPFRLVAGQVTDDTQMATVLAASLLEHGGLQPPSVAEGYAAWWRHAFDVGNQTATTLGRIARGVPAEEAGWKVWEQLHRRPAGNGSLMRCAPIGVFFAHDRDARMAAALADSAITHADPRCQLACAAFCGAIARALQPDSTPGAMVRQARTDLHDAAALLLDQRPDLSDPIGQAHVDLRDDLDLAAADEPDLYSESVHILTHQGFVRVAFRLAFWHLLHTASVRDALVDVVNRGGDADTNGAIAGALLGAAHGRSALPAQWVATVLACEPPAPWDGIYHPRHLLALSPRS